MADSEYNDEGERTDVTRGGARRMREKGVTGTTGAGAGGGTPGGGSTGGGTIPGTTPGVQTGATTEGGGATDAVGREAGTAAGGMSTKPGGEGVEGTTGAGWNPRDESHVTGAKRGEKERATGEKEG